MTGGLWALLLFCGVAGGLLVGFPVAFTLAGVSLIFASIGILVGQFDPVFLEAFPNRLYGIMTNETLIAVPVFVFMGVMLERSKLAEQLLTAMALLLRRVPGGLSISVMLVGALMAASTGIVGATVVTMGLLSLPTMLNNNYRPQIAAGTICAAGTLGQIIPPSIVLVLLGDVISNAHQQAQLRLGNFSGATVSVGELFAGALVPGLLLLGLYLLWLFGVGIIKKNWMPQIKEVPASESVSLWRTIRLLLEPLILIVAVLGSILKGIATPTEAASVGAIGAMLLAALNKTLTMTNLKAVMKQTVLVSSMVFMILIGASLFSLVFRGFGGDEAVQSFLTNLPGGAWGAIILVMLVMFLLGFVLDFIEIVFVVVPIVGPILLMMGIDPIWLGIMIAVNLQTSFLTPPFGFALFYLRGVASDTLLTSSIYRGVIPFIVIQLLVLLLLAIRPELVTWLPNRIYG